MPQAASWKNHVILALKFGVVIIVFAYLIGTDKLNMYEFRKIVHAPVPILIACLLLLVPMIGSFIRYQILLRAIDIQIPTMEVFRIGFIGCFFNTFMLGGLGGDVVKVAYVVRASGNRAGSVASVIVDRLLGLLGMIALGGAVMAVYHASVIATPSLHGLAIGVVGVLGGFSLWIALGLLTLARGRGAGFVVWFLLGVVFVVGAWHVGAGKPFVLVSGEDAGVADLLRSRLLLTGALGMGVALLTILVVPSVMPGRTLERFTRTRIPMGGKILKLIHAHLVYREAPMAMVYAFLLSVVTQAANMATLYYFAQALDLDALPSMQEIFYAAPVAFVANCLPVPGGGLGVGEAVFAETLALATGGRVTGGADIFLLWRFWFIVLGLIGLPMYLRGKKDLKAAEEAYLRSEGGASSSLGESVLADRLAGVGDPDEPGARVTSGEEPPAPPAPGEASRDSASRDS